MKATQTNISQIFLNILVAEDEKKIVKKRVTLNNREVFENGLKELYWSKRVLIRLLDQMIRMSSSENLADMLEEYQVIAHRQSRRIEDIFALLSMNAAAKICLPVKNIIHDSFNQVNETARGYKRDTEFVSVILKMQTYWTTKCESLCELAEIIEEDKIKTLIEETQLECKLVDIGLEHILETRAN